MFPNFNQIRNLPRYQQIISVLVKHGFGIHLSNLRILPGMHKTADKHTTPEHLRLVLEELGPTFIKLGQILSTRPDLIPPEYIKELEKLQDEVTPSPAEEIQAEMLAQYKVPLEQVFAHLDPQPLGSASLSQVHAAELLDGSPVVVKVQRPGIAPMIDADLEILFGMAQIAQHSKWSILVNPVELVAEFARILRQELDYHQEGLNIERFGTEFAAEEQIQIPHVYWEYSGKTVLVMERLTGIKIDDIAALESAGFRCSEIASLAARLIAHEMLSFGFFHADPHPGNFFITSIGKANALPRPCIGLLDFGMVGFISQADRLNILQCSDLAIRADTRGIVDLFLRIGAVSPSNNLDEMQRHLDRLLRTYRGLPLKDIQAGVLVQELMQFAFHYHMHLPVDLWLLFKTVAMLEGLAQRLAPDFDVFSEFTPYARRIFIQQRLPWVWGATLLNDLQSFAYSARDLPSLGEGLLRSMQRGEFPLTFKMGMSKDTLDRLDKITTRLSLSLMATAFILGVAILFPVTSTMLMAEILVRVGFFLALGLGMWVTWSIIRSTRD